MSPIQRDSFENLKWRTPLSASFPLFRGRFSRPYTWDDAVLDTASPVHVLPGSCPSFSASEHVRTVAQVPVRIRLPHEATDTVSIPSHETHPYPIGGVEGTFRWRLLFWTVLDIPGIPDLDFAPVIFMDIPHPIISVGLCVKSGMRFTFDANGFSVR